MADIDVWYENIDGGTLCFKHAVEAAMRKENIYTKTQDNSDAGMSGVWWLGHCKLCLVDGE